VVVVGVVAVGVGVDSVFPMKFLHKAKRSNKE
jgi:hypothetical protein